MNSNDQNGLIAMGPAPVPQMLPPAPAGERDYQLLDLWKILQRRRLIILSSVAAALLIGIVYCLVTPRLYKAQAQLQILRQDAAQGFSGPDAAAASAASDALEFNLVVQTQVDVLKSRNMALRVIHELKLDQTRDYQLRGDKAENGRRLEDSPKRLDYVLTKFDKRMQVESVSGTRLVSVSFLDRDPQRAAQVVNQVLADFIEYNYQVRFDATSQATALLSNELKDMKAQVEASQANVANLQQKSGIYGVDETNNAVNARLDQLNTELTAAQANRVVKESIYKMATTRSPEILAGMLGAQGTGGNSINAPLQMLRQQQAEAAANYAELNARYGPEYPKVVQEGMKLKSIQASIDNEINRLVGQATAEYKVASDTENAAAAALQKQKALAAEMDHNAIIYTSAKHDADTGRDLYEQLQKRLKEAGVLAGLRSTDLNVLDPAIVPDKAAQPRSLVFMAIALVLGCFLGLVAAFLAEVADTTVRDPQQIEEASGFPVLGLIPPAEKSLPRAAIESLERGAPGSAWQYQTTARAPRSVVAESFRGLRTAILTAMPGKSKVLAITSTSEAEGKSFITFNLAAAFAQSGRTVLVIDADLRKRTLTSALGLESREGLDEAVSSATWQEFIRTYEEVPGLFVLPAGQNEHFPADVLGSSMMIDFLKKLKSTFDVVLIDTPSILPVTDTVSLSGAVDAVMVVAKCGKTARHSLARTLSVLRRARARVLGVVLNGIDFNSTDFYYYWGRHGNSYVPTSSQILSPAAKTVAAHVTAAALAMFLVLGISPAAHGQVAPALPTLNGTVADNSTQPTQPIQPIPASAQQSAQQMVIGAGDLLSIRVYDAPELDQDVRVESSGMVHLALLGDLTALNLQPEALARDIENDLSRRKLITAPHVTVSIKEFTTQGVTIEGQVEKPGLYPVYSDRSLVDIVALAGGLTPTADTRITVRRHGSGKEETVTLPQNDATAVMASDVRVYPGDTVIVPRAGLAYVLGDVAKPGGYIMKDNGRMTVLQAISEAQGTTPKASLSHVVLLRKTPNGTETIPIQLKAMQRGKEPDQILETGDVLFVPSSGLKSFGYNTEGVFASISGAALYTFH